MSVYLHSSTNMQINLAPGQTVVGRNLDSRIVLHDASVSRVHALFERQQDYLWLTDLQSSHGTFVNGKQLAANHRIQINAGDVIHFALMQVAFTVYGAKQVTRDPYRFGHEEISFKGVDLSLSQELSARYRPIKAIASGGMGKIVLAQETLSGRFVALKIMQNHALTNEPFVHQFIREAVITARLQHPFIIPVYELGFLERHQLYYTMRYVDKGSTLRQLMPRLTIIQRLRVLRDAAMAVSYAHKQGLWHRDIKPENILIGPIGEVYVIDWGLVSTQAGKLYNLDLPQILAGESVYVLPDRLIENTGNAITVADYSLREKHQAQSKDNAVKSQQRARPQIIGTPQYMAPEAISKNIQVMGSTSDIWAFGIMLFEALTNQHPIGLDFVGVAELFERIQYLPTPSVAEYNPNINDDLNQLTYAMLHKDPYLRLQTLDEFIAAINKYVDGAESVEKSSSQIFLGRISQLFGS